MIDIFLRQVNGTWYGLACSREEIAATALGSEKEAALRTLLRSLPASVSARVCDELTLFAERTILTLEKLHRGEHEPKSFALSSEYLSKARTAVFEAAAHIPAGYVASYGSLAKAAGTDARAVGQMMASNPLYPIVPCHRVVGTDFSLTGYGGSRSTAALKAKLSRLRGECKGFKSSKEISINGATFRVYPVEKVIEKAKKQRLCSSAGEQLTLIGR